MKVCGKKNIHVPGCSDCQELEERVEAVEECCEDAQTKIEDKADTTYVDENIGTIEGQITEMSDALNERIDNIITSSEPSITTLWEGALALKGDSAQLNDDVSNYDFLDVYYKTSYYSDRGYYGYIRVPADEYENYTTTIGGINRSSTGTEIHQYLTMLSFVDDTATIQDIRRWSWDGNAASDAEDSSYLTGIGIYRIDGVKISGVDAEIADAREGVDGTIYPSLGDAIRGQIQDTRDMIPQLVKTVTGNPIVLDDAFGEVKNLDVELTPIQEGSGTPSPQNVRPITGHDSVTVTDTGKNLLALPVVKFSDASATIANCFFVRAGTYMFSYSASAAHRIGVRVLNTDGTINTTDKPSSTLYYNAQAEAFYSGSNVPSGNQTLLLIFANDCYVRIVSNLDGGGLTDAQLELGSAASDYAPYYGQSKTVTLPHTVYGAGVGVTSGESKDKMIFLETDSTTNYSTIGPARQGQGWAISVNAPTVTKMLKNNGMCYSSINEPKRYYEMSDTGFCRALGNASFVFYITDADSGLDSTATSAQVGDAVINYLHTHQMQAVYELKTPTDLSTTPTDLTLYNGDNVVSSDGDMELTYVQDMAIVIRKIESLL